MSLVVLFLAACCGWAQVAPAPADSTPPVKPQEKCVVEGSVVNGVSGDPLKKAHVILRQIDNNPNGNLPTYGAITGADGRFSVIEIDPGRYSIYVMRTGFVRSSQTSSKRNTVPSVVTLNAGQTMKGLGFKMIPQAVVAGRVVDEDNEPVSYSNVSCMRYQYTSGNKMLRSAGSANTNDKGEFRIFGLAAGKCYISASPPRQNDFGASEIRKESGNEQGYVTTYYPNSVSWSSAIGANVGVGAEVSGLDIRLMRAKTVHVSGAVANIPPQHNSVNITMLRRDSDISTSMMESRHTALDPKGRFMIRDVSPGSYTVMAMDWQESPPRSATALVDVADSHIEGLQLALGMDPDISGTLVTEGVMAAGKPQAPAANPAPPAPTPSHVSLQPDDGIMYGNGGGSLNQDGTFVLKNLGPARYRLYVSPMPPGAYVKRVQMGDQEIRGGVFDFRSGINAREIKITISMNGGQVEGVVRHDDQPSANAAVVLIPDDHTLRNYYGNVTSDQNGHYIFRGVAPGKYKLYAFDEIENGAYQDPDFMQPYENRGEALEIAESAHETRDLKLIFDE